MKIAIESATLDQLRAFAEQQNLDIPPTKATVSAMRVLIGRAFPTMEAIDVADEGAMEGPVSRAPLNFVFAQPTNAVDMLDPQKVDPEIKPFLVVELQVHAGSEDTNAAKRVHVSVDGRDMVIPRGQKVEIPYPYYEALYNARGTEYVQTGDLREEGSLRDSMQVQAYPFQVFRVFEETDPIKLGRIRNKVDQIKLADQRQIVAMQEARTRELERARAR